jgi:hypothetical protein
MPYHCSTSASLCLTVVVTASAPAVAAAAAANNALKFLCLCCCSTTAQVSEEEVIRGWGAFYDPTCPTRSGAWNGINCCRTCIWHNTSVAQFNSDELPACPPCVRQYYEESFRLAGANLDVIPLTAYLNPEKCPFGANGWLHNPVNDRCYYKSSGVRGLSFGLDNAITRCFVSNMMNKHRQMPGVKILITPHRQCLRDTCCTS